MKHILVIITFCSVGFDWNVKTKEEYLKVINQWLDRSLSSRKMIFLWFPYFPLLTLGTYFCIDFWLIEFCKTLHWNIYIGTYTLELDQTRLHLFACLSIDKKSFKEKCELAYRNKLIFSLINDLTEDTIIKEEIIMAD